MQFQVIKLKIAAIISQVKKTNQKMMSKVKNNNKFNNYNKLNNNNLNSLISKIVLKKNLKKALII